MRECQLILTVRGAAEARAIEPVLRDSTVAGPGIPWRLDIKDPSAGALGRPSPDSVSDTLQLVAGRWPVSVAWGELTQFAPLEPPVPADWRGRVDLLKLGLAGLAGQLDWPDRLAAAADHFQVTAGTGVVAVIYADGPHCDAPAPDEVVRVAAECDCPVVLIDTYDKRLGSLTQLWSATQLQRSIDTIHESGRKVAVAGSLRVDDLPAIHACGPDYVALRSALCHGDRTGQLSVERVRDICRRWTQLVAGRSTNSSSGSSSHLGESTREGDRASRVEFSSAGPGAAERIEDRRCETELNVAGPRMVERSAVLTHDASGMGGRS